MKEMISPESDVVALINPTRENASSSRILTTVHYPDFLEAQVLRTVDKPVFIWKE